MIHENSAHHLRRNAEKMRSIPPVAMPLIDQTQVELVHERGRLQREAAPFAAKLACGHPTQLRVDERQQLVEGIGVTSPPFSQKRRHVGPGRHADPQIAEAIGVQHRYPGRFLATMRGLVRSLTWSARSPLRAPSYTNARSLVMEAHIMRGFRTIAAIALCTGLAGVVSSGSERQLVFTTLEVPGAVLTNAQGINARGDVVGFYVDAAGLNHGFLWSRGEFASD